MSIDAFNGRNPSYCFLDLHSEVEADFAVQAMQGELVRDHPVKISLTTERPFKIDYRPESPRFLGDSDALKRINRLRYSSGAQSHWTAPTLEHRRLYVGGLSQIPHQNTLNAEMAKLFEGYDT